MIRSGCCGNSALRCLRRTSIGFQIKRWVPNREFQSIRACTPFGPARARLLSCDHKHTEINNERRNGVRNRKNYGKNQTLKARPLLSPRRTQTSRIRHQTKQRRKAQLADVLHRRCDHKWSSGSTQSPTSKDH